MYWVYDVTGYSATQVEMGKIANFDDFEDQTIKKSDLKDEDQIVISEINFKIIFMGIFFSFSMYFDRNLFFSGKKCPKNHEFVSA